MRRFNPHVIFFFGFLSGTIISIFLNKRKVSGNFSDYDPSQNISFRAKYTRKYLSFDVLRYGSHSFTTEADFLFKNIKILCLILVTKDKNFQSIKNTWGNHCNSVDRMHINKTKGIFPSKADGKPSFWIQFCERVKKTPKFYNWLLVVNDDTYVIMDNLRHFLLNKNSTHPFYLGYSVQLWSTTYNLGKAGYVLSEGTISSMKLTTCDNGVSYRNKEDFLLGNHLKKMNISVMDTKDELSLSLFHPYNLNRLLFPVENHKFQAVYETKCCSRFTITFNAMDADKMYTYHYMLYTLQLFYDGELGNRPAEKPPDDMVWKKFLKAQNKTLNISNEEYYNVWDRLIDSSDSFGRNMRREDYSDVD